MFQPSSCPPYRVARALRQAPSQSPEHRYGSAQTIRPRKAARATERGRRSEAGSEALRRGCCDAGSLVAVAEGTDGRPDDDDDNGSEAKLLLKMVAEKRAMIWISEDKRKSKKGEANSLRRLAGVLQNALGWW
ncbi:hypothetical protein Vretimale_7578 [Volvox reticuliferus]|uniref:Uncharacterized protein n=1 Tax=Volvox reticuliferus TaxID=1737510 RepID=A0A8J4LLN3_9CHLO|nr:hypothetical protein Vretifemale_7607 [Volvox reticuliferus]GIM02721.1 hypothetical protein Vretimale_7578 [Volvox reticuliferus]